MTYIVSSVLPLKAYVSKFFCYLIFVILPRSLLKKIKNGRVKSEMESDERVNTNELISKTCMIILLEILIQRYKFTPNET